MWLRAGMAATNSRGSERGESMTLLLEEEQKRSAAAATAKFELENGDAAREAVRREFEAEQLAKTNRQLKGMIVRLRDELKETQRALACQGYAVVDQCLALASQSLSHDM